MREDCLNVKKRLGVGASSIALLVERDGQESVLKIARTPDDNSLLEQEAEVLKRLGGKFLLPRSAVGFGDELEGRKKMSDSVRKAPVSVYANAKQNWAFMAPWKIFGLELGAGN